MIDFDLVEVEIERLWDPDANGSRSSDPASTYWLVQVREGERIHQPSGPVLTRSTICAERKGAWLQAWSGVDPLKIATIGLCCIYLKYPLKSTESTHCFCSRVVAWSIVLCAIMCFLIFNWNQWDGCPTQTCSLNAGAFASRAFSLHKGKWPSDCWWLEAIVPLRCV